LIRLVEDESDGDIVTADFETALARATLDWLGDDYDELIVEGAVRTSGANPGRRPGDLRFTRRLRTPPDTP
jgi:hypothetical protein